MPCTARFRILYLFIVCVVSYECQNLRFTLQENRRDRLFDKKVLMRIFWVKTDEVTQDVWELHSEVLRNVCFTLTVSEEEWNSHITWKGEVQNCNQKKGLDIKYIWKYLGKASLQDTGDEARPYLTKFILKWVLSEYILRKCFVLGWVMSILCGKLFSQGLHNLFCPYI